MWELISAQSAQKCGFDILLKLLVSNLTFPFFCCFFDEVLGFLAIDFTRKPMIVMIATNTGLLDQRLILVMLDLELWLWFRYIKILLLSQCFF
jgi:hypothetical protein